MRAPSMPNQLELSTFPSRRTVSAWPLEGVLKKKPRVVIHGDTVERLIRRST